MGMCREQKWPCTGRGREMGGEGGRGMVLGKYRNVSREHKWHCTGRLVEGWGNQQQASLLIQRHA